MKVIVGLGNPGSTYSGTRHNVGFMVAARFADQWSISLKKKFCDARVGEGVVEGHRVRVVLPQIFMNASGQSVSCLLRRWRLQPSSLLVVCDDVSLPLGRIRLRAEGSNGGHRGLASILDAVKTQQVPRLRVGIFSPKRQEGKDLTDFVMGRFDAAEKKLLEKQVASAVEACGVWLIQGVSAAMNLFNVKGAGKCRLQS